VTALAAPQDLTLARALEIVQAATKDKSFLRLPFGQEVERYLASKKKVLTPASRETWESALHKLVMAFPTCELKDFELPAGGRMLERFMDERWGDAKPATYNKILTVIADFFKWQVKHGYMKGNPADVVDRAKPRDSERRTFTEDQVHAVLASATELRDRIALRLLFVYGLRRGELLKLQVKHADYTRKKITIFGKGGKVRRLPIPHPAFWTDWERWILETGAEPDHFLFCSAVGNQHHRRELRTQPASERLLFYWWVDRLAEARVPYLNMHSARHTAGQRLLDATGNLKAVQVLLRHSNIATTASTYVDWNDDQLAASMLTLPSVEDE